MKLHHQSLQTPARAARSVVSGLTGAPPAWLSATTIIPPTRTLARPIRRRPDPRQKVFRKAFLPPEIKYYEDKLREEFYSDHPWELARPVVMVEGVLGPVERMIKRWHTLVTVSGYRKDEAYDMARREFYAARHRADIERAVAREEALFVGAVFGPGPVERAVAREDRAFDAFVEYAFAEKERKAQRVIAAEAAFQVVLGPEEEAAEAAAAGEGEGAPAAAAAAAVGGGPERAQAVAPRAGGTFGAGRLPSILSGL